MPIAPLPNALVLLDFFGIAVFAVSGALLAAERRQTLVTFLFFAVVTGVGGGTLRDLLIGAPVFWVQTNTYLLVCMGAALLTIVLGPARADFVRSLEEGAFKLGNSSGKRRIQLARYLMNLTPDELDELVTGLEDLYARFDPDPTVQRPGTIPVSAVSLIHPRWVRPR